MGVGALLQPCDSAATEGRAGRLEKGDEVEERPVVDDESLGVLTMS